MIDRIERALNRSGLFYGALTLACLILVGVPLLYFPANNISPDTFQYLSIANYYLMDPSPALRDAYTVGPVIPILIAIFKFALSLLFEWNRVADVFLLKGLSLLFYLIIVIGAGAYLKTTVPALVVYVFLLLFMGLPAWETNTVSLNGELVSVAWLVLLLTYLKQSNRPPNVFIVTLLAVLAIYTKIQSVPLLSLLLVSFYYGKKEKWLLLIVLVGCIILAESVLYANGIGLLHRAGDLLSYMNHPASTQSIHGESHGIIYSLAHIRYIKNLPWAVRSVQNCVPLFGLIIVYFLLANPGTTGGLLKDWRLWLLALFITIETPGYTMYWEHYVLYAMLFVILFAEPVLRGITATECAQGRISILSLAIVVVLMAVNTAESIRPITDATLRFGPEVEAAAALTREGGGRVHLHGYDYRLYTYFYGWDDGTELPYVAFNFVDPNWYIKRIKEKKYKYIIDIVGYSGFITDPSYKITASTIYGRELGKYYELVSDQNGLRVFRLKAINR
jgi:hypothetical protein